MFDKGLTKPIILDQHEAILRRLPENHHKRSDIDKKTENLMAGYNGEKTINYFLGLLPPNNYHIFHDLRLPAGDSYFQIDALLLSPKFVLIIEGKNFSGTLFFEKNQLTQEKNEMKKTYQNPLSQATRHKILLSNWFEKYQISLIPIEHLVCISNTSTTINISPGYMEAEKRVCKAVALLKKIDEFEKMYKKDILDQKNIGKIKRLLLNKNTLNRMDILKTYEIEKKEILTGVQCPKCLFIPMQYKRGSWECSSCHTTSKDAYLQAICDYFLIIKTSFTNGEIREFLHLPSTRVATYLISLQNLPSTGSTKGKVYFQSIQR